MSLVLLGDLVSIYLAVLRGVDPTPVEVIERLKEELPRRCPIPSRPTSGATAALYFGPAPRPERRGDLHAQSDQETR